jgi:hypothetical protein
LYREPGQEGKSGEAGFKVSRFQGFRGFKDPEVSRLKVEMPGSYFETLKL